MAKQKATTARHKVHWKFRKQIASICLFIALVAITLTIMYLDFAVIKLGLFAAGLTFMHFTVNFFGNKKLLRKVYLKEVVIAIVVTTCFVGFPILMSNDKINTFHIYLIAHMFFVNLANLLIFSWFDLRDDLRSGFLSGASVYGEKQIRIFISFLLLLSIAAAALIITVGVHWSAIIILFLMPTILILIVMKKNWFEENERYRFFGDFIYTIPCLALPFL